MEKKSIPVHLDLRAYYKPHHVGRAVHSSLRHPGLPVSQWRLPGQFVSPGTSKEGQQMGINLGWQESEEITDS